MCARTVVVATDPHADRGRSLSRYLLIIASLALIATGGATVLHFAAGAPSAAQAPATTAAATPTASSTQPAAAPDGSPSPSTSKAAAVRAAAGTSTRPGVPVHIDIAVSSTSHPDGVHTTVTAHPLNADQSLFVPSDPTEVAWASQDAAPGSGRGTVILVSHVNYVINGRTVTGAFSDLAEYARTAIGAKVTLQLADGQRLVYRIAYAREYSKQELAAQPQLRRTLYDQSRVFGTSAHPSSRLLLVSCGGAFDPITGEYEDNVFLYALPVG